MTGLIKAYTDATHLSEVAHTPFQTTTINVSLTTASTTISFVASASMPTQGYVDVDTAGNLEVLQYYGLSGGVANLAKSPTLPHSSGVQAICWYYLFPIGDQTNGIPADGTNATPVGTNVGTWYLYNAGDQTCQSLALTPISPASGISTTSGFADVLVSITSANSGFAASITSQTLAPGAVLQFWLEAAVPNNQSPIGNPQACQLNISYLTV